jgi:ribosomal protein S18 acetylase RimI-like enzyme
LAARFAARWQRALHHAETGQGLPLIALHEQETIGHGQLLLYPGGAEIADIGVVPAWRHRGVATKLVEALLAAARHAGLARVELGVEAENERVMALYRQLGFQPCRQVTIPGREQPAIILELELRQEDGRVA